MEFFFKGSSVRVVLLLSFSFWYVRDVIWFGFGREIVELEGFLIEDVVWKFMSPLPP